MYRPSSFSERLNKALELKHITKAELSRATGISKSSLTRYSKGDWEGKQDAVYAISRALNVNESWLMGYDVPMERVDLDDLLKYQGEENQSGRTQAKEEMFRLFGTEHSAMSSRLLGDKVAILYYKAMNRQAAPELLGLVNEVEGLDYQELENIRLLVQAYLRAAAPIREIVDTALKPYRQEESLNEEIG